MAIRRYATMAMVIFLVIGTLCYLRYGEYVDASNAIADTELQYKTDRANLISTVYYSLKRDAKARTEFVTEDVRESIVKQYSNNWSKFNKDYNDPKGTPLVDITSTAISTPETAHMYVVSDANDMFVLTRWGVLSDESKSSSDATNTNSYRTLNDEYNKQFNKPLAKQSIAAIFSGKDVDIYWQYTNSLKLKAPVITDMDINNLFNVNSLEDIRDVECLVYSSIDDNSDITGLRDVSQTGTMQTTNKLYIVQGFNLYEQIKQNYSANFKELDTKYEKQLMTQNAEKDSRSVKLVLLFIIMIFTFISMSTLQNMYVRGAVKYGGNTR